MSREERIFAKARQDMRNEIDIVQFLKKLRRIEAFQIDLIRRLGLTQSHKKGDIRTELRVIDVYCDDDPRNL